MVPTLSSCATRRMETASKPSLSAIFRAAAAMDSRLRFVFCLDIRTLYHYRFRTMYETTIIIAGAGPTGLTLAVDLARRGISFRLVEAAAVAFEGSRGQEMKAATL